MPASGLATISKYFGKKPGQTLAEVAAEIRELTDKDKEQLIDGIQNGTLTY